MVASVGRVLVVHAVLGAAVAAAGDNNALAGALSAGGAEAAAPYISKWLYGKDKGSDLTAEEKETVSAITNLLGTATGAVIGDTTANAAQGSLNAQSAVENNWLTSRTFRQNLSNRAKQGNTDAKRMLEIENLLRQYGIQDIEDVVARYNQNKDYETYKIAREYSDKIITSLIICNIALVLSLFCILFVISRMTKLSQKAALFISQTCRILLTLIKINISRIYCTYAAITKTKQQKQRCHRFCCFSSQFINQIIFVFRRLIQRHLYVNFPITCKPLPAV